MIPEDKRDYYRAYRAKNKDKIIQNQRKYVVNNPDKVRESKKTYTINNPDKNKVYYQKNKSTILTSQKEFATKNPSVISKRTRVYREKNLAKAKAYAKEYYLKNKTKLQTKAKSYYNENKLIITTQKRTYSATKRKTDPIYKLKELIKNSVRHAFKNISHSKNARTETILGCTIGYLKSHIEANWESWMNWNNHGQYNGQLNFGWDIDHIVPLKTAMTEDDVIKLCHYTNLQPLCSYINRNVKRANSDL